MKRNKIVVLLGLVAYLILSNSCSTTQREEPDQIGVKKIDLSNYEDFIVDTTIIEEFSYLPLENKYPIGAVDKLLVNERNIFVFDRRISRTMHCFNREGEFEYFYKGTGKGPGEFIRLYDMDIDENGNLYLLDIALDKVIRFNNGTYVSESKIGFKPKSFGRLPNNGFMFYVARTDNPERYLYEAILWDASADDYQLFFPFEEDNSINTFLTPQFGISRSGNILLYCPNFSETIYRISSLDSEPEVALEFDFGKYSSASMSLEMKKYYADGQNFGELLNRRVFRQIDNVYETSSKIVCRLNIGSQAYLFVYSKNSGKYLLKPIQSLSRVDGMLLEGIPYATIEDMFVSIIPTTVITSYMEHWRKTGSDESILEEKKISFLNKEEYRTMANPVITFYKIKDF